MSPDTVTGYKYPGRATCIRIQVDTCRRYAALTTILSPIQDTRRRWQGIQVDTTCIRATCICCKRGLSCPRFYKIKRNAQHHTCIGNYYCAITLTLSQCLCNQSTGNMVSVGPFIVFPFFVFFPFICFILHLQFVQSGELYTFISGSKDSCTMLHSLFHLTCITRMRKLE